MNTQCSIIVLLLIIIIIYVIMSDSTSQFVGGTKGHMCSLRAGMAVLKVCAGIIITFYQLNDFQSMDGRGHTHFIGQSSFVQLHKYLSIEGFLFNLGVVLFHSHTFKYSFQLWENGGGGGGGGGLNKQCCV